MHLQRVVDYEEASTIAKNAEVLYYECSAKEYSSIDELILIMIDSIYQNQVNNKANIIQNTTENIHLKKIEDQDQGCF